MQQVGAALGAGTQLALPVPDAALLVESSIENSCHSGVPDGLVSTHNLQDHAGSEQPQQQGAAFLPLASAPPHIGNDAELQELWDFLRMGGGPF